ncbi:MAG: phenylacetic acid degradation bifunctional protein PaaZ [Gammaproteobacteria bacterium]|nr:phenylacetic acid degradation bifunctional protein PaaZ [Gammaproteobacteria bacterium]
MVRSLESYAQDRWHAGARDAIELRNAVNGDVVALASSSGLDFAAMLEHGRRVGGPALRKLTFHQRALMLKALAQFLDERKSQFYTLSTATGATRPDSRGDIDGGLATLFVYASKGRRELPNDTVYVEGAAEIVSRGGSFIGQHVCVPLEGVAVQINAYNFPCWGMLEKLAPCLLAGVPAIVKPASSTAYLTEAVFRAMVESGILPPGAVQLVCGGLGDLFDHLTCQDVVAFTGSAGTALKLRSHPRVLAQSVRFTAETDSLNCSVLGPDAGPGTPEFELYVKEVVREMTAKAGQKCTAIRRAIVPERHLAAVIETLCARLAAVRVGNPALAEVDMGALASLEQRAQVRARVAELAAAGEIVYGSPEHVDLLDADAARGAFLSPILIHCRDRDADSAVHRVEAFGPVSTVIGYGDVAEAVTIANLGQGSLAASVVTGDDQIARTIALGIAPWHGRVLVLNRDCAKESTGHGVPLPHLVHGGPGRAGGGEEMGGVRGVLHYMQRTALQGSPTTLTRICNRWMPGAATSATPVHPFRRFFEELNVGDTTHTATHTVTIDDIERFAKLTGDEFYAHMDEEAARANPFFDGRVAHGYFVVSRAAGLFVDPAPGPVLANYGLENLRFTKPVYPGDTIGVRFTCKQKTAREGEGHGEVRWDTEIRNQNGETVAAYDVLTMVARRPLGSDPH